MYKLLRFLMAKPERIKNFFYEVKHYQWVYGENYIVGTPREEKKKANVVITAHYDTVVEPEKECHNIFVDKKRKMVFGSVRGDDRAGCYAIHNIITTTETNPYVVLCDKEESGSIGATEFITAYETNLKQNVFKDFMGKALFYIALDRGGYNDAVYYTSDSPKFKKFISHHGFKEANGTTSDIKHFETRFQKCGVNLSIGYKNNHTSTEMLNIKTLETNIEKVKKILTTAQNIKKEFKYKKIVDFYDVEDGYSWNGWGAGGKKYHDNYIYPYTQNNGVITTPGDALIHNPEDNFAETFPDKCTLCGTYTDMETLMDNYEEFGMAWCNKCISAHNRGSGYKY